MTEPPAYLRRFATWSLILAVPLHAYQLYTYAAYGTLGYAAFVIFPGVLILLLTQCVLWVLFLAKREWRRPAGWRAWTLAFLPLLLAVSIGGAGFLCEVTFNPHWADPPESYEPVIVDDGEWPK